MARTADLETMSLEQRQQLATEANSLYCTLYWLRCRHGPSSARGFRLERLERRALNRVRDRDLHSRRPRCRVYSDREVSNSWMRRKIA